MTERSNSPGVASGPTQREAGTSLDTAIIALRRGEPVLLTGARDGAALALAAELADDEHLSRLREMSGRTLSMVLTRRRAIALGLAPREALSGAVAIALSPDLPASVIPIWPTRPRLSAPIHRG